ncbi:MAG: hypothetical protein A2161_10630 [Candidatus Schekmanbacteria bacterium RBG_13_48_7]|uniref:SMP-30/Gluconolactonase/LRE-like region domain-containing protein n=1 Tax=Candidatus Schekmanbacteria bacterium RBG_13_48_7 TaxID=1817878 RepID=A0A1F7RV22_9BACT|nr:MAG: hypothetical protein A2161_10630 [Candidatus Schekmanbacteria bacterium RBG_13_48_7]
MKIRGIFSVIIGLWISGSGYTQNSCLMSETIHWKMRNDYYHCIFKIRNKNISAGDAFLQVSFQLNHENSRKLFKFIDHVKAELCNEIDSTMIPLEKNKLNNRLLIWPLNFPIERVKYFHIYAKIDSFVPPPSAVCSIWIDTSFTRQKLNHDIIDKKITNDHLELDLNNSGLIGIGNLDRYKIEGDSSLELTLFGRDFKEDDKKRLLHYKNDRIKIEIFKDVSCSIKYKFNILDDKTTISHTDEKGKLRIVIQYKKLNLVESNSFGKEGFEPDQIKHPVGIQYTDKSSLLVCDSDNYCVKEFHTDGSFIRQIGSHIEVGGFFKKPFDVIIHRGKIYVSDRDLNRIVCLNIDAQFERILCAGQVIAPLYLAAYGEMLFVSEENGHIKKIDLKTHTLKDIQPIITNPRSGGMTVFKKKLYVCQTDGIGIYELNGKFIDRISVSKPRNLIILDGYLVVISETNMIKIFNPSYNKIETITNTKTGSFDEPTDLYCEKDQIWITDYFNNKIYSFKIQWK